MAAPMDEFRIRPADGSRDRAQVIDLVTQMWQRDISSRWDWLYERNPHGRALTWVAVDDSNTLVAVTSIFPRKIVVAGRNRVGSMGGDCYVAPRARRRGLATKLHKATRAEMKQHGVDFMFGPPRPNNLEALLKAGSHLVTTFRRFTRPLSGRAAYRALFKRTAPRVLGPMPDLSLKVFDRITGPSLRGWTLEPVTEFGEEFDRLFERSVAEYPIIGLRDRGFLTWRYLEGQTRSQKPYALRRHGELCGLVAFERDGERMVLCEAYGAGGPETIDRAIELALREAAGQGASNIDVEVTVGSPLVARLKRRGFVARDEHGFQLCIAPGDDQEPRLRTPSGWHFVDGDKDMDTVQSGEPE
jgi:GNAT superfamily N-acetyltransferase